VTDYIARHQLATASLASHINTRVFPNLLSYVTQWAKQVAKVEKEQQKTIKRKQE
jgi:hypothetical protein